MLSDRCPDCPTPVLSCLYRWCTVAKRWIKIKHSMQVGLGPGHFVLDGDPALPPPKGHSPPIFGPYLLWPKAGYIKISLNIEVGLGPGDFVSDGDPAPPPQKWGGAPSQFSAHVHCGQTAGWIKIALGMEVGLGPGHNVPDALLPQKWQSSLPNLGPYLLRPNGWMHQDATWYGGSPHPRRLCVRWGPRPRPQKGGGAHSLIFGPCLLWPSGWMDQDGTWHGDAPWSRPHCARWDPAPLPKKVG